jgi:nitrate/nitrite transporter NarK
MDRGSLVHGQFYAMSFMKPLCPSTSQVIHFIALVMGTPFFIVFGWLSDKIGRKYIMMGGLLLAIYCTDLFTSKWHETTNVNNKTEIVANTKIVSALKKFYKRWILFTT